MSHLVRTSKFTEKPEPLIVAPAPEVRSTDIEDGTFSNRKGFIVLRKKCEKMGYATRLTYARGFVVVKKEVQRRHSILLWVKSFDDVEVIAGAHWEAPAPEGVDWVDAEYKTHGALIRALPGRFGNKELEAWLLDPTTDPRDKLEVGP